MGDRRSPVPPFDAESARQKVLAAEAAWNTRDPDQVAGAYSVDSEWRNRSTFLCGRDEIRGFLAEKWARELEDALRKDLWAFAGNRIAVRFQYESLDEHGQWWRSYGNENWESDEYGAALTVGTALLRQQAWSAVIYGLLIAGFAVLLGDRPRAVDLRRRIAPALLASTGAIVAGTVVGLLLLIWWSPGRAFNGWTTGLVLIALVIGAVVALRTQIQREFPDARADEVPTEGTAGV